MTTDPTPPEPSYIRPTPPPTEPPKNGLATSGMVLGIVAAGLSIIPVISVVALPVAIIGLPLSGIGFWRSRTINIGKGASIAGLATNIAALGIWSLWALLWGAAFTTT